MVFKHLLLLSCSLTAVFGAVADTPPTPPMSPRTPDRAVRPSLRRLESFHAGTTPSGIRHVFRLPSGVSFVADQQGYTPSKAERKAHDGIDISGWEGLQWKSVNAFKYLKKITDTRYFDWTRIPNKPGIYRYRDEDDNIVYIGKAWDLAGRASGHLSGSLNVDTNFLQNHPMFADRATKAGRKAAKRANKIKPIKFEFLTTESFRAQWLDRPNVTRRDLANYPRHYMEPYAISVYMQEHGGNMPRYNVKREAQAYDLTHHRRHQVGNHFIVTCTFLTPYDGAVTEDLSEDAFDLMQLLRCKVKRDCDEDYEPSRADEADFNWNHKRTGSFSAGFARLKVAHSQAFESSPNPGVKTRGNYAQAGQAGFCPRRQMGRSDGWKPYGDW